eukprot:60804_1
MDTPVVPPNARILAASASPMIYGALTSRIALVGWAPPVDGSGRSVDERMAMTSTDVAIHSATMASNTEVSPSGSGAKLPVSKSRITTCRSPIPKQAPTICDTT